MLSKAEFTRLLQLRAALRRFTHWSEQEARAAGITPAQHQLLLAIKGHPEPDGPTIGELAGYLILRHHSVVGLVDRAAAAGLIKREPHRRKPGTVRLRLTREGSKKLDDLAEAHRDELIRFASIVEALRPSDVPADALPADEDVTARARPHKQEASGRLPATSRADARTRDR